MTPCCLLCLESHSLLTYGTPLLPVLPGLGLGLLEKKKKKSPLKCPIGAFYTLFLAWQHFQMYTLNITYPTTLREYESCVKVLGLSIPPLFAIMLW